MSDVLPVGGLTGAGPSLGAGGNAVADLLHCLGFAYLRHGQARRAAVLLMTAGRAAPERPDILRTLAAALVEAKLGDRAEEVLNQLSALDPATAGHPMMRLLRARALLLQGRADQARDVFGTGIGGQGGQTT